MDRNRSFAVAAGVAFIVATVAHLIGVALTGPILQGQDYLTKISVNQERVILGALLQSIGALACPAIAIALYPVLRKHGEGLALGSVGFRTIEGALQLLIAICILLLVSVSRAWVGAGAAAASTYEVAGSMVVATRAWLGPVSLLAFGLGAIMYYWVFYRSRLVPRWLSVWGLVAIPLLTVSALLVMFGVIDNLSTTQVVLALPLAVQEMVLAVWLITKGFDPRAIVTEPAGETPAGLTSVRPATV